MINLKPEEIGQPIGIKQNALNMTCNKLTKPEMTNQPVGETQIAECESICVILSLIFRGSSPPVKAGVRAISSNFVAGQAKPEF